MAIEASDRHPEPPVHLDDWPLPLVEVSSPWYRCHSATRSPRYFNRGRIGRFNAPNGEYGVMYLGTDEFAAFVETFGQSMRRDDRGVNVVSEGDLAQKMPLPDRSEVGSRHDPARRPHRGRAQSARSRFPVDEHDG